MCGPPPSGPVEPSGHDMREETTANSEIQLQLVHRNGKGWEGMGEKSFVWAAGFQLRFAATIHCSQEPLQLLLHTRFSSKLQVCERLSAAQQAIFAHTYPQQNPSVSW